MQQSLNKAPGITTFRRNVNVTQTTLHNESMAGNENMFYQFAADFFKS